MQKPCQGCPKDLLWRSVSEQNWHHFLYRSMFIFSLPCLICFPNLAKVWPLSTCLSLRGLYPTRAWGKAKITHNEILISWLEAWREFWPLNICFYIKYHPCFIGTQDNGAMAVLQGEAFIFTKFYCKVGFLSLQETSERCRSYVTVIYGLQKRWDV